MNNKFFYLNNKNFGDGINRIFFDLLANKKFDYNREKSLHYLATGSILKFCNENSIIIGTGFIDENDDLGSCNFNKLTNKIYHKPNKIILVRGPKTRNKLIKMGIPCPENYGDPLILFPLIYNNISITEIKNKIGLIPHYIDYNNVNSNLLKNNLKNKNYDVELIDIMTGLDYKPFIDKILSCEIIISSSLHGIIMGIIYKKKVIFTEFSDKVIGNKFKFFDFFESINIKYNFLNFDHIDLHNNYIDYHIDNLKNIGINMINLYPFIKNERKINLIYNWEKYWN
jgi:pyruvyltransferase